MLLHLCGRKQTVDNKKAPEGAFLLSNIIG